MSPLKLPRASITRVSDMQHDAHAYEVLIDADGRRWFHHRWGNALYKREAVRMVTGPWSADELARLHVLLSSPTGEGYPMELYHVTRVVMSKSRCANASPAMKLTDNQAAPWTPLALAVPRSTSSTVRAELGVSPVEGAGVSSLRAVMEAVKECLGLPLTHPALAELARRLGSMATSFLTAAAMQAIWGVKVQQATSLQSLCNAADDMRQDFVVLLGDAAYDQQLTAARQAWHDAVGAAAQRPGDAYAEWAEAEAKREYDRLTACRKLGAAQVPPSPPHPQSTAQPPPIPVDCPSRQVHPLLRWRRVGRDARGSWRRRVRRRSIPQRASRR